MSGPVTFHLDHLRSSIGRETSASDIVTSHQCEALEAVLDCTPRLFHTGDEAPLAIHWCLAQPTVPTRNLGPDGHPARGDFLPHVALPSRMWAGGKLRLLGPIRVGDRIVRHSRIDDVALKDGRTGPLCFVTISHLVSTPSGIAIEETQDIVYRTAEPRETQRPAPIVTETPPMRQAEWTRTVVADPVLLFRYSALTFNAHRIHYDRDYSVTQEGYPGLVVHGPLQATMLLALAAETRGAPKTFQFRGRTPLFDGGAFTLNAAPSELGLDLWTNDAAGQSTMTASSAW
jgi:3-methylfumaryl-CoA hydratase